MLAKWVGQAGKRVELAGNEDRAGWQRGKSWLAMRVGLDNKEDRAGW